MADIETDNKTDTIIMDKLERLNKPDKPIVTSKMLKANTYLSSYLSNGYNGTQAYKAIYPHAPTNTAQTQGSVMLREPMVQGVLQQVLDRHNASIELQIIQLANIAKGEYTKSTIYETYDADGSLVRKQVVSSKPSAKDITSAINLIARLTGQYDAMRVNANAMSSELKRLYRQHTTGDGRRSPVNVATREEEGGEGARVHIETDPSLSATKIFNRGISPGVNEQGEVLCKDGTRKGKRGGARVKRPLTERIKDVSPRGSRAKEGEIIVKVDSVDCSPDLGAFSEDLGEV